MVPTFLQIAVSDSTLWPSQHNFTTISVAHVLASDRHELGHFIYTDSLCSMAYGMPQVLEYDTSTPPFDSITLPVQGCPVCPAVLQFALIDMNKLCGQMHIRDDWRSIERRILTWEAPVRDPTGVESWKVVTHLAIEETWRQTLLIYLYMVSCFIYELRCDYDPGFMYRAQSGRLWCCLRRSPSRIISATGFSTHKEYKKYEGPNDGICTSIFLHAIHRGKRLDLFRGDPF